MDCFIETPSQVGLPGSWALILALARNCRDLLVSIAGTQPAGVSSGREGEREIDSQREETDKADRQAKGLETEN